MPYRRFLKSCVQKLFAGAASLALLAMPLPVAAQTQSPPPSILNAINATDTGNGEIRILLTFAPQAPKFSIISNDTDRPSIAFALSSRGSTARAPTSFRGVLRWIAFDQNDTILIVNFQASATARISATAVGEKTISIIIAPVADGAAKAPTYGASNDRPADADGFEVVPLKYADVSEVVGLLTDGLTVKSNDNFTPREPAFGSSGLGGASTFTPIPQPILDQPAQPVGQSVNDSIAIDRRLNAVILKGSPDRIARLKEKILKIDVPVESVVLETMFVELSETGARNVGLDFNNANSQIAVATFTTGAFTPAGFPTNGNLSSVSLQAAIYAQVQAGHGRIVSKPRISAQSGSSAKIITGDALPILTSIALSGVNAVSQQVQYVNVGVTLQIAPRVSSDGYVTSHVFGVVSSVTGFSQGYPTISQREADTSATVRDGETFVIGGLTEENEITSRSHIPGLGDIPILGNLFRLRKDTSSRRDLYIVVTPHIAKRGEKPDVPDKLLRPDPPLKR